MARARKRTTDAQLTALSGEFFVAAELLKRGLQCSVTFGNAKAIDLFAYNPRLRKQFAVQVKALKAKAYFPISHAKVEAHCIYVFAILNKPGKPVEYFVVPGGELLREPDRFGKYFAHYPKFPGIYPRELEYYRDRWDVFDTGE